VQCLADFFKKPASEVQSLPERVVFRSKTPGLYESIDPKQTHFSGVEVEDELNVQNNRTTVTSFPYREGTPHTDKVKHMTTTLVTAADGKKTLKMQSVLLQGRETPAQAIPQKIKTSSSSCLLSTYLCLRQMKGLGVAEGGLSSATVEDIQNIATVFEWRKLRDDWGQAHPGKIMSREDKSLLAAELTGLYLIEKPLWESGHKIVRITYEEKKDRLIKISELKHWACSTSALMCEKFRNEMKRYNFNEYDRVVIDFSIRLDLAPN
jgi:hypothetical protein